MNFEFVDTLPGTVYYRTSKGGRYREFVTALSANPGKWGVLPYTGKADAASVAGNIRSGHYVDFREGQFQVASRNGKVYVRYIGGDQ